MFVFYWAFFFSSTLLLVSFFSFRLLCPSFAVFVFLRHILSAISLYLLRCLSHSCAPNHWLTIHILFNWTTCSFQYVALPIVSKLFRVAVVAAAHARLSRNLFCEERKKTREKKNNLFFLSSLKRRLVNFSDLLFFLQRKKSCSQRLHCMDIFLMVLLRYTRYTRLSVQSIVFRLVRRSIRHNNRSRFLMSFTFGASAKSRSVKWR